MKLLALCAVIAALPACRTAAALTAAERAEWDLAQRQHADAALALKILTTPYNP